MVAVQIDGVNCILGLDPEMPNSWTSPDDHRLAELLNREDRHYHEYRPDPQMAEAQAVVDEARASGKSASIVGVDQQAGEEEEMSAADVF